MSRSCTSIFDKLESELQCSVCQGRLKDPRRLDKCLHVFCYPCLTEWINASAFSATNIKCPECRSENSRMVKDCRLENLLSCLSSFGDASICQICNIAVVDGELCTTCKKRSCTDCVSTCATCEETLCGPCMSSHVSVMKAGTIDLIDEIHRSLSARETKDLLKKESKRLEKAIQSFEGKKKALDKNIEREREVIKTWYIQAMKELENKRQISLCVLEKKKQELRSCLAMNSTLQDVIKTNGGAWKQLSECREEESIRELIEELLRQREHLMSLGDSDSPFLPDFQTVTEEQPNKWIMESLIPVSAWRNKELLFATPGGMQQAESFYETIKTTFGRYSTGRGNRLCEIRLFFGSLDKDPVIVYNAMLRLTPTDVRQLWLTTETPERYFPFLQILFGRARKAYEKCNLRYDLLKVYGRLIHTEWRSVVTMVQLLQADAESGPQDEETSPSDTESENGDLYY